MAADKTIPMTEPGAGSKSQPARASASEPASGISAGTASGKRVLLIIGGGISAYKSLELIRLLAQRGAEVRVLLTKAGAEFVTPLSLATLSGQPVRSDLFSLDEESEIGHIRLAREADCIVVAPATADLLARTAAGRADDLAAAVLLAAEEPPLFAPAMNPAMWAHPATRANAALLASRGAEFVGPAEGDTACGEEGLGRMAEPAEIEAAVLRRLARRRSLAGLCALVTSGPTREPLDAVRFLSNASSGRQGHAVAAALARAGASVRLVSGPVALPDPAGVETTRVATAREMLEACLAEAEGRRGAGSMAEAGAEAGASTGASAGASTGGMPLDVAVCAAAVSDWRPAQAAPDSKRSKAEGPPGPFVENPDILAALSALPAPRRPRLVVGFAAETGPQAALQARAEAKRRAKGCDWMLANDITPGRGFAGAEENEVTFLHEEGSEHWPRAPKQAIAEALAERIALRLAADSGASGDAIRPLRPLRPRSVA